MTLVVNPRLFRLIEERFGDTEGFVENKPLDTESMTTLRKLLRDSRDFIGKSRCSVGHSVSEVRDRAKAKSCIYCESQFALYEALGAAISISINTGDLND